MRHLIRKILIKIVGAAIGAVLVFIAAVGYSNIYAAISLKINSAHANQKSSMRISNGDDSKIVEAIIETPQLSKTDATIKTGYPNEEAIIPIAKKKIIPTCPKPTIAFPDYSLANVGQSIPLPYATYIPSGLTLIAKDITNNNETMCLKKDAKDALEQMIGDAKDAGYSIIVTSAYRSFDTQKQILENWVAIRGQEAYMRVAKPGYSEHQLGVTVDLSGSSIKYMSADETFGDSPEAGWLEKNADTYGFVESYPKDMQDVTGYLYEPWHYRYVGIDNASEIKKENTTITEFLAAKEKGETETGG